MIPRSLLPIAAALVVAAASGRSQTAPCWESNFGTNLSLGDDQVISQPLGFTFPGPAGPVSQIEISSNGFVWLSPSTSSGCCSGTGSGMTSGLPRIAPLWTDLNPRAGGGVYFRSGMLGGNAWALVTWNQVPEYGSSSGTASMQLQLLGDGTMIMTWRPGTTIASHTSVTGVTQGNNAPPNAVDLSSVRTNAHFSGTNPTVYEEFPGSSFDLAGSSLLFIPNGQGGYIVLPRPSCAFASISTFGVGCVDAPGSFYEDFPAGAFDLAGSGSVSNGVQMFLTGQNTYAVLPGSGAWFAPGTNTLAMGDDTVVQQALPFPFPHQGGMTNDIWICSNGYIWLQASTRADYTPSVAELLAEEARLSPLWTDLNPSPTSSSGAGSVHFDVDPVGGAVYVTWLRVGEYSVPGASHTFQVALTQSGVVEYRYLAAGSQNRSMITGWSPGGGTQDPGGTDISISVPFATGSGAVAIELAGASGSRPVLGGTLGLLVENVPTGAPLGFLVFGVQRLTPALDLTALGMPGCFQYVTLDSQITFQPAIPTTSISLPIPSNTSLTGIVTFIQSAIVSPLSTPLGLIASNGAELQLGM